MIIIGIVVVIAAVILFQTLNLFSLNPLNVYMGVSENRGP